MKELESPLEHESSSKIQKVKTTGYKRAYCMRNNGWINGVATQTRNEPKCPVAKSANETINEMTKDKAMKRSNDARKCCADRIWNDERLDD